MSVKIVQLDMFRSELEMQNLQEHEKYKLITTKSIRRLFAEIGDIGDVIMAFSQRLDRLEEASKRNG
jgi:hypothetical protein